MAKKISVTGGDALANNAFGGLDLGGLPAGPAKPAPAAPAPAGPRGGKIHLRIEKSGRSGKTVTVLFGETVAKLGEPGRVDLLKTLQGALGCGGAAQADTLELQGDVRERAADRLRDLGFSVK